MGQEAVAGARVNQEVLGRNGVPQEDEVTARKLSRKWPWALGSPGVPARNREGGSGGRGCQTARDNNKHTGVEPLQGGMAVPGKSGPGKCGTPESGHCVIVVEDYRETVSCLSRTMLTLRQHSQQPRGHCVIVVKDYANIESALSTTMWALCHCSRGLWGHCVRVVKDYANIESAWLLDFYVRTMAFMLS